MEVQSLSFSDSGSGILNLKRLELRDSIEKVCDKIDRGILAPIQMGTSEKAFKIITIAAIASVAAYFGYRAYRKKYPYEELLNKTVATDAESFESGNAPISI